MKQAILILAILALCVGAMADTVTTGSATVAYDASKSFTRIDVTWISAAGGGAGVQISDVRGLLNYASLETVATSAPTTLYDVTLHDAGGTDILYTRGTDIVTTGSGAAIAVTKSVPLVVEDPRTSTTIPRVAAGPLTLSVTNAGADKTGVVRIYIDGRK